MKYLAIALLTFSTAMFGQLPYKNFRSEVPTRPTEYYASTSARGGVKLTITAKFNSHFKCYPYPDPRDCEDVYIREYFGLLEQSDGKVIDFSPDAPAEKIIDRELVPWAALGKEEEVT